MCRWNKWSKPVPSWVRNWADRAVWQLNDWAEFFYDRSHYRSSILIARTGAMACRFLARSETQIFGELNFFVGIGLEMLDRSKPAIHALRTAEAVFSLPSFRNDKRLDEKRLVLHSVLGQALLQCQQFEEADLALDRALTILDQLEASGVSDLQGDRVSLLTNSGMAKAKLGDWDESIVRLETALDLHQTQPFIDLLDSEISRIFAAINFANVLIERGEYKRANGALCGVKGSLESMDMEAAIEPSDQARFYLVLGDTHSELKEPDSAIDAYQRGLCVLTRDNARASVEREITHGNLLMSLGITLTEMEQFGEAIERLEAALSCFNNSTLSDDPDVDAGRYRCWASLGNVHMASPSLHRADQAYITALEIQSRCSDHADALRERAGILLNLALVQRRLECFDAAIASSMEALDIYEDLDHWLPIQAEYAGLLANSALLLDSWPNANDFSRRSSSILQSMVELRPDADNTEMPQVWAAIQEGFDQFHEDWLLYAAGGGYLSDVPHIAASVHAREELRERFIGEKEDVEPILKEYREQRRELSGKLEQREEASKIDALARQLAITRAEVQRLPGYEGLSIESDWANTEQLQPTLRPRQAILLFLAVGETKGAWLLPSEGPCLWVDIEGIDDILAECASLFAFTSNALRRDRFAPSESNSDSVLRGPPLPDSMSSLRWAAVAEKMRKGFWQPIQASLGDLDLVHICTHGATHHLPLGAGMPSSWVPCFYPSLVHYAIAHGLISSAPEPDLPRQRFGILSAIGKGNSRLNAVTYERESLCKRFGRDYKTLKDQFYGDEVCIERFHFAGHGKTESDGFVSLLLDSGARVETVALRHGQTRFKHVNINACSTGRLDDDSRGSPLGLVTAFLNKGARSVLASTEPVDDAFSELLAFLWYADIDESGNGGSDGIEEARRLHRLHQGLDESHRWMLLLKQLRDALGDSDEFDLTQMRILCESIAEEHGGEAEQLVDKLSKSAGAYEENAGGLSLSMALLNTLKTKINFSDRIYENTAHLPSEKAIELFYRRVYVGLVA